MCSNKSGNQAANDDDILPGQAILSFRTEIYLSWKAAISNIDRLRRIVPRALQNSILTALECF